MELVEMENGAREEMPYITDILGKIARLQKRGMDGLLALADLVDRCRNPRYHMERTEANNLMNAGLMMPDGKIDDRVRAVVMAAAVSSGMDLKWKSPVKAAPSADEPSLDEISAIVDNNYGLQQCIMASVDRGGITMQQLGVFVRNTPDGKKGPDLWREFTSRRDKPGRTEPFGFPQFILEVIAEKKN
jgi:hypothetical protein